MYTMREYCFPETEAEALELLGKNRLNRVIGGGMWLRLGRSSIRTAIDLSHLGWDRIEVKGNEIVIGAMVTLRELEASPLLQSMFDGILGKSVSSIVGVQFRSMATVGGSVFLRPGYSDLLTALLALDTRVELLQGGIMSLEDFLASPRSRDILKSIRITMDGRRAVYLTQRRTKTDFGVLDVCLSRSAGGEYRLSIGARPGIARRCPDAEDWLRKGNYEKAAKAAARLPYGSNTRGSAAYRRVLAEVLTRRAAEALEEVKNED